MKKAFLKASAVLLIWGCSENKDSKPKPKSGLKSEFNIFSVVPKNEFAVFDENNQPLVAEVLIGTELNNPFNNNLVRTDVNGLAEVPVDWKIGMALPVTVRAPGYISVSYFAQEPHSLMFHLRKASSLKNMQLAGSTSGYNVQNGDDQIDFGLVMKGLTKAELLGFDINRVISPDVDVIKIAGQEAEIPSNISLPRQRESYVIPITVDKNPYRLSFYQPGPQKVIALRGRFPFKKVIDEIRAKKSFVDLLNLFSIDGGTLRDVTIAPGQQILDLDLAQLKFNSAVLVPSTPVGTSEVVLAAVAQQMNGIFVPTDIKKMTAGQSLKLKAMDPAQSSVLKVLKRESEFEATVSPGADRLSAIYSKADAPSSLPFLELIENPRVQGQDIVLDTPASVPGVVEYATYLTLSELQEITVGKNKVRIPVHRWEIFVPGWAQQISLPQRPFSLATNPQWRWEVSFLGGVNPSSEMGPETIENTTHVTRSSIDF